MQAVAPLAADEFGGQLLDSISIPEEKFNLLFAALLVTAVGVFLGENVLLWDRVVVQGSIPVAAACLAVLLIFYSVSRLLQSMIWGLVLTYGLLVLLVYSRWGWLVPVIQGCAVLGLGYAIRFLRVGRREWPVIWLLGAIATVVIVGCSRAPTSFDMLQRLHAGDVRIDTLFHASIAAMIKNYGVVSTGLHGLIEIPNHVFSHELMAGISILSGVGVFEVYGVANWVLFAPLLIFSIVACCVMLDTKDQVNVPLAWGLVCMLLVLLPRVLKLWDVGNSYFKSESLLVSLGLFLFGLAVLFKRRYQITDLMLIVLLAAEIARAKGPVGLVYAGLWLCRIIFLRGEKLIFTWLGGVLVAVSVGWMTFSLVSASMHSTVKIAWFDYIINYSVLGQYLEETAKSWSGLGGVSWSATLLAMVAIVSFFAFHFLLSWVVVVRLACRQGGLALLQVPAAVYVIGSGMAGALVMVLFAMPSGAASYFSCVAMFVALPEVVFLLLRGFDRLQGMRRCNGKLSVPAILIFIFVLLAILGAKSMDVVLDRHRESVRQHSAWLDSLLELRQQTPMNVLIKPNGEALLKNPISRCSAQPFLFPAISERPWMDVIAARSDCGYEYFGYEQYGLTPAQNHVTVRPRLLPGMQTLDWPSVSGGPRQHE
ncbi:MAG: hypothetical protein HQL87_03675 [Magnetococcales bacterium]|nr:hypothetical protein [Magnetococcales bacterium]